jgi:hypothetical protein
MITTSVKQRKMEDETIKVGETSYSLRKILEEDGWKIYSKASEKVRRIVRLKVRLDLSAMQISFAKLDKLMNENARIQMKKV